MWFCKMERFGIISFLILIDFSSALDQSLITVSSVASSGVVLLTGPRGQYKFNFSEGSEACLFKDLYMATKSQLQTALDHGLEGCRFGWLSEEMAAVPRRSSVFSCGSGLLGVVTWNAPKHKKFGVWCFNSSDSKDDVKASTITPKIQTTSAKTTLQTTTFTTSILTTITTRTSKTLPKTSRATNPTTTRTILYVPSTLAPWIHSTVKPQTSAASTTVSTHFSTITTTSLLGLIHSSSLAGFTPTFVSREMTSGPYESTINTVSVKTPGQRVSFTALIISSFIVLILLMGGAFFHYKVRKRCVWSQAAQKDDTETEMWRQTSSDMDLQNERKDERREREEEKRFTISSENMLYTTELQ